MKYKVSIGWGNDFIFTNAEDAVTFIRFACENKAPGNDYKIHMEVIFENEVAEDEGQE